MDDRTTTGTLVDLLRSIITGGLFGGFVLALGIVLDWSKVWTYSLLATTGAALLSWLRSSTPPVEVVETYQDPQPRVVVLENGGHRGTFLDNFDEERFIRAASRIIDGQADFTLSTFGGNGKMYSRSEFERLRDLLVDRGFLRWRNPAHHNRGVDWSPSGRALLRTYASMAQSSPTLISPEPSNGNRPERDAYTHRHAQRRTSRG